MRRLGFLGQPSFDVCVFMLKTLSFPIIIFDDFLEIQSERIFAAATACTQSDLFQQQSLTNEKAIVPPSPTVSSFVWLRAAICHGDYEKRREVLAQVHDCHCQKTGWSSDFLRSSLMSASTFKPETSFSRDQKVNLWTEPLESSLEYGLMTLTAGHIVVLQPSASLKSIFSLRFYDYLRRPLTSWWG